MSDSNSTISAKGEISAFTRVSVNALMAVECLLLPVAFFTSVSGPGLTLIPMSAMIFVAALAVLITYLEERR